MVVITALVPSVEECGMVASEVSRICAKVTPLTIVPERMSSVYLRGCMLPL